MIGHHRYKRYEVAGSFFLHRGRQHWRQRRLCSCVATKTPAVAAIHEVCKSLKHCMCGLNGKQVLLAIFRFISVLIVQSDRMWIYTDQNLEVKKKVLNSYK